MEHTPVYKLPPDLWASFKQSKTVRIDQLNRQSFSKLGGTSSILPIDTNSEITITLTLDAQTTDTITRQADLAKDRTGGLLVLDNG